MKSVFLFSCLLLLAGCVVQDPQIAEYGESPSSACLFDCMKQHSNVGLTNAVSDVWIRLSNDMLEYGYCGENVAALKVRHIGCESRKGCKFIRTGKGRSGEYYLWQDKENEITFGKINDHSFMPVRFILRKP